MNNKAIFDNKALNQLKKITGSGGGMVLVDELPEIGKEDTLYKTPDGKIWSCINTTKTETKTICDLEVGESFTLKDKILAGDIVSLCDKLGERKHRLGITESSGLVTVKISPEDTGPVQYEFVYASVVGDSEAVVHYDATDVSITDLVTGELLGFKEFPSIEITELLVENLTSADLELLDLAFAFVNGSHTETTTTTISTWTEVGGSSGVTKVNMTYDETTGVTLSATTEQIYNMLQNGIVVVTGKYYGSNYNAIILDGDYYDEKYHFSTIISNSDYQLTYRSDDDIWYIEIPA